MYPTKAKNWQNPSTSTAVAAEFHPAYNMQAELRDAL